MRAVPWLWRPAHRAGRDPARCARCRNLEFCGEAVTLVEIDGALMAETPDGWLWSSVDGGESWQTITPDPPPPLREWTT